MVSRKDKNHAISFICGLVEDSNKYRIQSRNHQSIQLQDDPTMEPSPRDMEIVIANFLPKVDAFRKRVGNNSRARRYTVPLIYKDGKTAFARMVDFNRSWRTDKSLKNYSSYDVNRMISLRNIEKVVFQRIKTLSFYQPESDRLPESIRDFELEKVVLDYSHLKPGDQGYGFAQNRFSIDYKLLHELMRITSGPINFDLSRNPYGKIEAVSQPAQQSLF